MQGTHLSLRKPTNEEDDAKGCQDIRKFLVPRDPEDLLQKTKSLKKTNEKDDDEPPFTYIKVYNAQLGHYVLKKSYALVYQ
jgi:hypothetical protein